MRTFEITWTEYHRATIEAESLDEALEKVEDQDPLYTLQRRSTGEIAEVEQ